MYNIPFLYHSTRRPPRIVMDALHEAAPDHSFTWVNGDIPQMRIEHRATKSILYLSPKHALFVSDALPRVMSVPAQTEYVIQQQYSFEFFALNLECVAKDLSTPHRNMLRQRMVIIFHAFANNRLTFEHLLQPWYHISWLNELNSTERGIIMRCAIEPLRSLAVYYTMCASCSRRVYTHFRTQELVICDECSNHL